MNTTARVLILLTATAGCAGTTRPDLQQDVQPGLQLVQPVRVKACTGPATSLPDSLAALVPPRKFVYSPDDGWAEIARTLPGGFAGAYYDAKHQPTLAFVRPDEARAASAQLAGKVPFPVDWATVQPVRWDFAQLVDWFDYILPRAGAGVSYADKDEVHNRIRIGTLNLAMRDSVVRTLERLDLPCDLVIVDLSGMVVTLTGG